MLSKCSVLFREISTASRHTLCTYPVGKYVWLTQPVCRAASFDVSLTARHTSHLDFCYYLFSHQPYIFNHPSVPWSNRHITEQYCNCTLSHESTSAVMDNTCVDSILQSHQQKCTVSEHCILQWLVQATAKYLPWLQHLQSRTKSKRRQHWRRRAVVCVSKP